MTEGLYAKRSRSTEPVRQQHYRETNDLRHYQFRVGDAEKNDAKLQPLG